MPYLYNVKIDGEGVQNRCSVKIEIFYKNYSSHWINVWKTLALPSIYQEQFLGPLFIMENGRGINGNFQIIKMSLSKLVQIKRKFACKDRQGRG